MRHAPARSLRIAGEKFNRDASPWLVCVRGILLHGSILFFFFSLPTHRSLPISNFAPLRVTETKNEPDLWVWAGDLLQPRSSGSEADSAPRRFYGMGTFAVPIPSGAVPIQDPPSPMIVMKSMSFSKLPLASCKADAH